MARPITLSDVTYALNYTPYDAANPDGYITSAGLAGLQTAGQVNTAVATARGLLLAEVGTLLGGYATTTALQAALAALVNGAPGTLDTLKELADGLAADQGALAALLATVASFKRLPVPFFFPGQPEPGQAVRLPLTMPVRVLGNLLGTATISGTLPTANMVFTLNALTGGAANTVPIGTVTLLPGGRTSRSLSNQALRDCAAFEVLEMVAPAVQDATGADIAITVACERV